MDESLFYEMPFLQKYMGDYLYGMMTNELGLFILVALGIGIAIQAVISLFVMANRRKILKEEYGFTDSQINGFFWKSVIFFPITWYLLITTPIKALWRRIRNR
jgi:hypothetical protein